MYLTVNTRFLIPGNLTGFGHYTHEILSRIAHLHPEDHLEFLFDRKVPEAFIYHPGVRAYPLYPPARHPLLFYIWYQYSVRRHLRHHRPDVFFSPDSFMPIGLDCPSVITIHDVAHRRFPEAISVAHRWYYDVFIPKFVQATTRIITISEFSRDEILHFYPAAEGKIDVVYNGTNTLYQPLPADEQEQVRNTYSQGYPYILFTGAIHPRKNVTGLIAAFNAFRKTSAQPVRLVIVGPKAWGYKEVELAAERSPYRDDIVFPGYLEIRELVRVTAAAHVLGYISLYEGFGLPVAEAMQSGVPVIVTRASAQSEVAGPAGLEVDPLDPQAIAEAFHRVFDHEEERQTMISAGLTRSRLFSWDQTAEKTYDVLQRAAGKIS